MKLPSILPTRYRVGAPSSNVWHQVSLAALAVTIAVLPWTSWPSAGDRFELPKILLLSFGVGIAFLAWLTGVLSERIVVVPASLPFVAVVASLGALALSTVTSTHFTDSVFGLPGAWTHSALAQLGFMMLAVLLALQLRDTASVKRFGVVFLSSTLLLAFVALYQLRGVPLIPVLPEGFTFLAEQPYALATLAALGVTLALFYALRGVERMSRWVRWGMLALTAVLLINVGSKLGYALTIVGFALLLVPVWWKPKAYGPSAYVLPSVGLGLAVLALLLLPLTGNPGSLSPAHSNSVAVSTLISPRAVTGVGPALFPVAFNRFRPEAYNNGDAWTDRAQTAGTEAANRAATHGVLGTLAFAVLLGSLLVALWRRTLTTEPKDGAYPVVAPVAIGLTLWTVSAFLTPWTTALHFYAWMFIGFGVAVTAKRHLVLPLDRGWPVPWMRIALPLATVATVVALTGWVRVAVGDHALAQARDAIGRTEDLASVRAYLVRAARANPLNAEPVALDAYATVVESQLASATGEPTAEALAQGFVLARSAVARSPEIPEPIENLVEIARRYGGIPESEVIGWFERLAEVDPRNPAVFLAQGQFLYALATTDTQSSQVATTTLQAALTAFQQASRLRTELPEATYGAALVYTELGQGASAEPLLRQLLVAYPEHPVISLDLGRLLNARSAFTEAIAVLEPANTASPDNAPVAIALADAYVGAERVDDAKRVLDAAIAVEANAENQDLADARAKLK